MGNEQAGTAVGRGHGLGCPHDRWGPCLSPHPRGTLGVSVMLGASDRGDRTIGGRPSSEEIRSHCHITDTRLVGRRRERMRFRRGP